MVKRDWFRFLLLLPLINPLQGCTHYNIVAAIPDIDEVQRVWQFCSSCVRDRSCSEKEECEEKTMNELPYALATAISSQNLDIARYLIEVVGMDVNTIVDDRYKGTSLHSAALHKSIKDLEVLRYLVSRGANVNAIGTSHARTPLLTAIWKKNTPGARLLLAHGADPSIKSDRGWDACMFAHRWSHWELMPDLPGCCARFLDKRWEGDPDEARVRPPELRAACRAPPAATPPPKR